MALEATHMRFALDLKDKYQVKDLHKYISGSIYPDSRYLSKIDRVLTHPKDRMEWDIANLDDFKKGWHSHLICDRIQLQLIKESKPGIFVGEIRHGDQAWLYSTAIKALQEIDIVKSFDVVSYLPCLNYIETPNGEDANTLREYNQIFIREYADPKSFGTKNIDRIGRAFGMNDEVVDQISRHVLLNQQDPDVLRLLKNIYNQMLNRALSLDIWP
ncbi:MAG: hypothetical protein PHS79_01670 [Patescibacteria group bacterium]|nr:hypothetical protein [Patescibacteria group bacterium]